MPENTLKTYPIKRRDWLILALVLFVAALMRLGDIQVAEFFHDEAMVSMLAQEMADGLTFPLRGIVSSVGIPNSPVSIYVMVPPFLISDDVLLATAYVAVLNIIGVGVLWWIAQRYFGRTVALIAGMTYAIMPWALLYSRKIWAQDYFTPVMLIAIALGLLGFVEGKRWAQILCLPVLLFALQIHFAAWVFLSLYLVLLWMGRRNLDIRALLLSLVLSVLVMTPFGIGIIQAFESTPDLLNTTLQRTGAGEGIALTDDGLRYTLMLATGVGMETWSAPQQTADLLTDVPPLTAIWLLQAVLMLAGVVVAWWRYRTFAPLLTLWVLVPLVVFSLSLTTAYPHYFIGALPIYALLIALGLHGLIVVMPGKPISRVAFLVGFTALLLTQAIWWQGFTRYVDQNAIALGEGTSGYTTPIHYLNRVRDAVRNSDDVLIISDGQYPLFDVEAARFPVILRDSATCVRTLPPDGFMVQPDSPFSAIIAPNIPTDSPLIDLYSDDSTRTYRTRRGDSDYLVTAFEVAPTLDNATFTDLEPITFANGVILTGYALDDGRVYLRWSLPEARSRLFYDSLNDEYQYFVHAMNTNGERIAQQDLSYWAGRHWCAGDTLVSWVNIDFSQIDTFNVGFYRLEDEQITPVDVLDVMGNPAGNWATVSIN